MPKTRPAYPEEFRKEVLAYMRLNATSQRKTAEHFGVSVGTLREWERRYAPAPGPEHNGEAGVKESAEQELARLRRENRMLSMRCEILKKTVSIFSELDANATRPSPR